MRFTNRFEIYTINLTLNLLLLHVVLNSVITRNSESMCSSTLKLLHTNSHIYDSKISTQRFGSATKTFWPICDFEISTQRFRSTIVIGKMQQLCFMIEFVVCTRSPVVAPKGYGKSLDLVT